MKEEIKKLNRYSKKYYIEGFNEMFQFIPYLKSLVEKDQMDVDTVIQKLPNAEIIKKDATQLQTLMRRTHSYFGFTVPVSYRIIESYIKGEDLSKYGERPLYMIKINGNVTIEEASFTTEELIGSITKPKEYVRKKR